MGTYGTYCGSADVRYFAQVQYDQLTEFGDESTFNSWVEGTLIPKAEFIVDNYVGHSFGTPSYGTLNLDGSGKSTLFLPVKYCPPLGFSAGSLDSAAINTDQLKCYDQYIRWDGGNFTEGKQNVVLYGSYGYSSLPHDIQYVTAQLCANLLLDMVRRNVAPDLFREILLTRSAEGEKGIGSLWASPHVFTSEMKEILEKYRIEWWDVG